MGLPLDHATLLGQHDFVVPANRELDEGERLLLLRYGRWLEALSMGIIQPLTPEQEHFVRVAHGSDDPCTEFERIWVKISRPPSPSGTVGHPYSLCVGPLEVANRIERLAAAKRGASAAHDEYEQKRAAVMELVRAQLEALEAEFSERLRQADEEIGRLEADVKEAVREVGESVKHEGVHAIYSRGRVSWDNQGLNRYAEMHPEVYEFRRIGIPLVSIRYKTGK